MASDFARGQSGIVLVRACSYMVLLVAIFFVGTGPRADAADARGYELRDDFESYPAGVWSEGDTRGPWYVRYDGYGGVGVRTSSTDTKYHYQKPMASAAPGETHASMVLSTKTFAGVDMSLRQQTAKQLRTGSAPNPWEVAWVVWGYRDDSHFYYFVFKPNGIELGKAHPGYPGAQRFLYTAPNPRMSIGEWDKVRVRQVGATIDVWVDGVRVVKGFVDSPGPAGDRPYTRGRIGMYNEDSSVRFDNVRAVSTG